MAKFRKKPVVIEAVQALQSECWKEHVPVTGTQHDPANGLIHGYCARCRREWPCEWAPESQAASLPAQPAQGGAKCVWVDDGGDKYATGCNKYLQVYAESEEAQQWVKFCCYCGKPVEHFEAADVEGGA